MERYTRQMALLGQDNQDILLRAKVLVIGSGGLGSPVLMALCLAGVGCLGIVDDDLVDLSNLNRQTLHDQAYVGMAKVVSAKARLEAMRSDIQIHTYKARLDQTLAEDLFLRYDVVVDCVDNYETRHVVSEVATGLGVPLIEGGIEGYYGSVQVIIPGLTACFNCLGGQPDSKAIYRQVLGAGTGVVGNIQALECIRVLTGQWSRTYSYLSIDLLTYDIQTLFLQPKLACSCIEKSGTH